jgi:hypothetical protein
VATREPATGQRAVRDDAHGIGARRGRVGRPRPRGRESLPKLASRSSACCERDPGSAV